MQRAADANRERPDPTPILVSSSGSRPDRGSAGTIAAARFGVEPYTTGKWPALTKRVRFVVGKVALFDGEIEEGRAKIPALLEAIGLADDDYAYLTRAVEEL